MTNRAGMSSVKFPVLLVAALLAAATATAQKPGEAPRFAEVLKDPDKYSGQKVTWIGQRVTFSVSVDKDGKESTTLIFIWRNNGGKFVAESPFVVTDKNITHTAAAKKRDNVNGDKGIRKVTGTIKGSQEVKVGDKLIKAPVLENATVDVVGS